MVSCTSVSVSVSVLVCLVCLVLSVLSVLCMSVLSVLSCLSCLSFCVCGCWVSGTHELRVSPRVVALRAEYAKELEGKKVIVSCDKMDRLSGITLKLTAFESLMRHSSHVWSGKVVLVQMLRLPYSTYASKELLPAQLRELKQIEEMVTQINEAFPESVRLIKPHEEEPAKRLAYFGIGSLYLNTSVSS